MHPLKISKSFRKLRRFHIFRLWSMKGDYMTAVIYDPHRKYDALLISHLTYTVTGVFLKSTRCKEPPKRILRRNREGVNELTVFVNLKYETISQP